MGWRAEVAPLREHLPGRVSMPRWMTTLASLAALAGLTSTALANGGRPPPVLVAPPVASTPAKLVVVVDDSVQQARLKVPAVLMQNAPGRVVPPGALPGGQPAPNPGRGAAAAPVQPVLV